MSSSSNKVDGISQGKIALPPDMLRATFLHAPGVGPTTERRLWEAGALSWEEYIAQPESHWPLGPAARSAITATVHESIERLEAEEYLYFAHKLPQKEHWRAVPSFGHRLAFLDIETNGGMEPSDLTVIGVYDGHTLRQYVQGVNLEDFPECLEETAVLVTFYGTGFDIPFLRRSFPNLPFDQMHVDLCHVLKRLGYRGGLKSIERQLGIARSSATSGLSGMDAVRLWNEYLHLGRKRSMETLLAYNGEDVRNMVNLLAIAYRRMAEHARG